MTRQPARGAKHSASGRPKPIPAEPTRARIKASRGTRLPRAPASVGREPSPAFFWVAMAVVIGAVLYAHTCFFLSAGALWRDEANSAAYAAMPSLPVIWSKLCHDSVPIVSTLVFRAWMALGLDSDKSLRTLGWIVGCSIYAAAWLNARTFRAPLPAASILLFVLNPYVIRYGDSVRPMGLGILAILVTIGVTWRALRTPSVGLALLAASCAVLSVHSLYHNAALLLGISLAGVVVSLRRGSIPGAALSITIAAAAGLSLLVYLPALRAARDWAPLVQGPTDVAIAWTALGSPSKADAWLWVASIAAGLWIAVPSLKHRSGRPRTEDDDATLFAAVALVASTILFLTFLYLTRVVSQPWYYLPAMAVVVTCLDIVAGPLLRRPALKLAAGVLLVAMCGGHLLAGTPDLQARQTNVDLVAARLGSEAALSDLVIVHPWYFGVSFDRYYRGRAPWTTVPPLADHSIHRHDLFKQRMTTTGAANEVLSATARILSAGSRVWVVGFMPVDREGITPVDPGPAPAPGLGWNDEAYSERWGMQVGDVLRKHAGGVDRVSVPTPGPVNPYENMPVHVFHGWRPASEHEPKDGAAGR